MLIKVTGVALSVLMTVVLARMLGPDDFGLYSLLLSFITLIAIPVQSGVATLLVREIARYEVAERWELIKGLITRSNQAAILYAVCAGGLLSVATLAWIGDSHAVEYLSLAVFLLVLLLSLNYVRGGAVRGFRRVAISQVPEVVVRPAVTIVCALVLVAVSPSTSLTLGGAVAATTIAAAVAFAHGMLILRRSLPVHVRAAKPEYQSALWARSVAPLSLIAGVQVVDGNADTIMLGALRGAADVGIYRVSVQAAAVVLFGLVALNIAVAPFVSSLYTAGDTAKLQRMINITTGAALSYSVFVFLFLLAAGPLIIPTVFGSQYSDAYWPMVILAVGYLMLVANGAVLTVATMLGFERSAFKALLIGAGANIMLNALLIPSMGSVGAAVATTVGTLVWRLILVRDLRERTGIRTSADFQELTRQLKIVITRCN
jgi:O-antigen/teichoic acid export membrane protein